MANAIRRVHEPSYIGMIYWCQRQSVKIIEEECWLQYQKTGEDATPSKGRALAAKRASSLAEELSLDIVIFEGDAQRLINQIIYEP